MKEISPALRLAGYVNMQIREVRPNVKGIVLEVGPVGRRGRHRLLLEGLTKVSEIIPDPLASDPQDWIQEQIDLGDEMYERQREEGPCES